MSEEADNSIGLMDMMDKQRSDEGEVIEAQGLCIMLYFILFFQYDVLEVANKLWGLLSKEVTK